METYQKIVKGVRHVRFPYHDKDAVDLVRNMLRHSANDRLTMRPGGTKNLKTHPWYQRFNWTELSDHTLAPPYLPNVKSNTDMTNFKASSSDLPPQLKYIDDGSGWDKDF